MLRNKAKYGQVEVHITYRHSQLQSNFCHLPNFMTLPICNPNSSTAQ